jgi:hypothetical protein
MAYKKMKCFNLKTGAFQGYLGTQDLYVKIKDVDNAAGVQWYQNGDALYLDEEITGLDRYLTNNWGQAKWEQDGGALLDFNADGSISLAGSPSRKLYYKNTTPFKEIFWMNEGETDSNILDNILKFESGLRVTHDCQLSSAASGDFWQHSMNAGTSWSSLRKDNEVAFCDIPIPADAIQLKLKIHNNCGRSFRMYVLDQNNARLSAFGSLDISPGEFKSFVFDVSNGTLPYKTQGPYLNADGSEARKADGSQDEVPDPKFTITRKKGG